MKFFSRKALVASATAVAVAFGGASVASAQTTSTPAATTTSAAATTTPAAGPTTSKSDNSSESSSDLSPKDIRDWIAVFTAAIGALGTLFAFLSKYFKMPF